MSLPREPIGVVEETALLRRIAAGDREALRELYARHHAALFSLALRLVGDRGAAEEILQDTFLKIWRHAARYDPRLSAPFTWAVTILRRTSLDHRRRTAHRPAVAALPDDASPASLAAPEIARDSADIHESGARVREALAALPPPQRDALELALYSTLTHAEIAARLAQPVGTVKSWIRRGLLALQRTLAEAPPTR